MSDIRNVSGKAKARMRTIKTTPMTRAVRSALAVSAMALGLGTAGTAMAAAQRAPAAQVSQFQHAAIDFAPVFDLTVVQGAGVASVMAAAIDITDPGDVTIDNDTPISEYGLYSATAIRGYSDGGQVDITNQAGADLLAVSYGTTVGIYGYSGTGDVAIDNAAEVVAVSYGGIADGIFASGANVDVGNAGDVTVVGYSWAAGIEAQGADVTTVDNSGDIYAATTGIGPAFGIYATGADVTVANGGNVEAQGLYATGIEAQSYGNIAVTNDGGITSGSLYGSVIGIGINAGSNGEGAHVDVDNGGDIVSQGYYGATGIMATASGLDGSVSVTNTGSIQATQYNKYGYGAYGIVASGDGDAGIDNGGTITVDSAGAATGAAALSFAGDASVTNSGDIVVTSDAVAYYGANGIVSFSGNGSASAGNSGNIDVTTKYIGTGIDVSGLEGATASNEGDISVDAWTGYGIRAAAGNGDVSVDNSGSIHATYTGTFFDGTAFGMFGHSGNGDVALNNSGEISTSVSAQSVGMFGISENGDVSATNGGTVSTYSYSGYSVGIFARADYGTASVQNDGSIDAFAYYGYAFGVLARGEYVNVGNSGDISADGFYAATGIAASSYYGSTVTNAGGSIDVFATGAGIGIDAQSMLGDVSVDNASDISAVGVVLGARGIQGAAYGDVAIGNSGAIETVSLDGDSIGIYGYSLAGDVSIDNSGDITAASYSGLADGIFASGANVDVANSGAITATTVDGIWAAGIEAQGADVTTVDNSGDIYAAAAGLGPFQAYGIYATGTDVSVTNSGNIEAQGYYATGVRAQSYGDVAVVNSGDIVGGKTASYSYTAYDYYGEPYTVTTTAYYSALAIGINAGSNGAGASVDVTSSGDISVTGFYGSTGIVATSSGEGGTANVTNTGTIYARQGTKYGVGAYGVVASADGDATVNNAGGIEVSSEGVASGAVALSFAGEASVTNSGDIDVSNTAMLYYNASGIVAFAANGDASASNSGTVNVDSGYWASGIDARGFGDVTVGNSGSVYANGDKYAFGVYAAAGVGDVTVGNAAAGEIGFYSYAGRGWGVFGNATQGDVHLANAGLIEGYAYGQSAGLFANAGAGDASATNSGSISVISGGDAAIGMFARANYGTASVSNSGDIVASTDGLLEGFDGFLSYGMFATGDHAAAANSGSIVADGNYYATGIVARSQHGTTVTTAAGSEIEVSAALVAIGIEGRSESGDVTVGNAGSIAVEGTYGGAVGIQAYGNGGEVKAANAGHIAADSEYGMAIGVSSYSILDNATATNSGTVEAMGYIGAYGLVSQSYLGDATASNSGHVLASSSNDAVGIFAKAYGDVTIVNSGSVSASSDTFAAAVQMQSLYGTSTLNNSGSISVDGEEGAAWAVMGDEGADTINNSGTIAGAIALYEGDDVFNNNAGGVWDVGSTTSSDFGDGNDRLNNAGTVKVGSGGIVSFGDGNDYFGNTDKGLVDLKGGAIQMDGGVNSFVNAGWIRATGSGNVIDMGGANTLTNVGLFNFANGATNDKLTVIGTLAGVGQLVIDANLANATADQLQVNGNVAANAVQTVNVQVAAMPTTAHTTVAFASVSGTSVAGNFVAGQFVGYNAPSNFLDLGLGVSSNVNAANTAPDVFSITVDVNGLNDTGALAASASSGAAAFMNSQVGTFRQRLGFNPYGDAGKVMSAFVRFYSSAGDVKQEHVAANFGQGGHFNFDQSSWGREIGVNANLFGNFHAGLVLGTADSRQRLTDGGAGSNRMDGMTVGGYATWYVPGGWYVDLSARKMAADIHSTSAAGTLTSRAHTNALSLEAGYEFQLGGFNLVPQAQYTRTEVEDVRTFFGDRANFDSHGGTFSRARLGLEFNKTFDNGGVRWTPYGSISAIREMDGKSTYTVADNFFGSTSVEGTSGMAELGLSVQKGGFGFNIGANWTDGGAYKSFVGGQANVRFSW